MTSIAAVNNGMEKLELDVWIACSLARILKIALRDGTYDTRDFEGTVLLLIQRLEGTDKEMQKLTEELSKLA